MATVTIDPWTLVLISLFNGVGTAAGQYFFNEYLKKHADTVVEKGKHVIKNGITFEVKK